MGVGAAAAGSLAAYAAAASAVVGVAGTALSAMNASAAGEAQQKSNNYQAQVAENNAILAKQNQEQATAKGDAQTEQAGLRAAAAMGDTKAGEGASGVDVNTGSSVDVRKSQRILSDTDAQTIRYNAASEARGFGIQADSQTAQARLDRTSGANAGAAGSTNAEASLLSGASSVGSKYASWQQQNGKTNPNDPIDTGAGFGGTAP